MAPENRKRRRMTKNIGKVTVFASSFFQECISPIPGVYALITNSTPRNIIVTISVKNLPRKERPIKGKPKKKTTKKKVTVTIKRSKARFV